MERKPSFLSMRSNSSFLTPKTDKHEFLPSWTNGNPPEKSARFRLRSIISHCLYRRVMLWAVGCILFLTVVVIKAREHGGVSIISTEQFSFSGSSGDVNVPPGQDDKAIVPIVESQQSDEYPQMQPETQAPVATEEEQQQQQSQDQPPQQEEQKQEQQQPPPEVQKPVEKPKFDGPQWLLFPHLNGFYFGLKSLVSKAEHTPEYPRDNFEAPVASPAMPANEAALPTPSPYSPYLESRGRVVECTLDAEGKVPVPDLYAYNGLPQYHPDPSFGSYDMFGMRDDVCFDRFGRYGPYGLGYSWDKGGTGEGLDTERNGNEAVWSKSGLVDYATVNWGEAQRRCFDQNKHRFQSADETPTETAAADPASPTDAAVDEKLPRIAIVIRTYAGFEWTHHSVLNLRAMISELSLKSGGEYDVHLLLHVHDESQPIWADAETRQKILDDEVPDEFHGLVTLWSEAQMRLWYPGNWDDPGPLSNPSGQGIHGVYRSAHMPLQVFAQQHPQYTHFWNWEMDMRYLGSYYELFDRLGSWANKQPRKMAWERSSKYYIPAVHGSWQNFTDLVERETALSRKPAVFGQVHFPGWRKLRDEERDISPLPANCKPSDDPWQCGVGEQADLITLNPMFDAENSGWVFANDLTGYPRGVHPPRRSSIITASRLSKRLLNAMHEENWRHHHSMFSEMFPATAALHHGLKAVYAPHPSYLDRAWEYDAIDAAFNGGRDHTSGGRGSPFDLRNEHNHKGTSWYYNSEFSGLLWRRWLGYAQHDGRGSNGGMTGAGEVHGGRAEEEARSSSGRMCLRQMLFHPIKWENPAERQ